MEVIESNVMGNKKPAQKKHRKVRLTVKSIDKVLKALTAISTTLKDAKRRSLTIGRVPLYEHRIAEVIDLLNDGLTTREVEAKTGISKSTVSRLSRKLKADPENKPL